MTAIDYRKIDTDRSPQCDAGEPGTVGPTIDPAIKRAERIARDAEARQRFQKGMHWK